MPIVSDLAAHYAHQRKPTKRRWAYAAGYLLMAVAGVFAGIWPSQNVSNAAAAEEWLVLVWVAFLVIGGICSSVGAATERWLGEYIGLPLLGSVFAVYGLAAFANTSRSVYAAGALFLAIALLISSRWLDVSYARGLARVAIQAQNPHPEATRPEHGPGNTTGGA
jgi:uncharacterized membrane protein HdeD (DUF308 family)